jgi:hypothetical protein
MAINHFKYPVPINVLESFKLNKCDKFFRRDNVIAAIYQQFSSDGRINMDIPIKQIQVHLPAGISPIPTEYQVFRCITRMIYIARLKILRVDEEME